MILFFLLIIFIFSVMIHEVSHGVVAYQLGDDTAKNAGRLNLNPLNHIDPMGSIFLPLFLLLVGSSMLFGWAKPVPYNPYNLRNPRKGAALIGAAGPLSNILIAVIFGILSKIIPLAAPIKFLLAQAAPRVNFEAATSPLETLFFTFAMIVFINILLAVFNLMPIPPLDGSKVLFAFLPPKYNKVQQFLEQYGLVILLFFIFFGIGFIFPIIHGLYSLIIV